MIYIYVFTCPCRSFVQKHVVLEEKLEDTKGVIRIRKSENRQHNGQMKKDKRTNNDLQNIEHKTKVRVTRTPLKTTGETLLLRKGK